MSKSYNVNREVNDAFYRYKMPAIVAKVEGKGNGIKTVIVNMVDIARALNREAIYPTKYFGIELGAQTHIDTVNERYIVNGSHDEMKLQEILDGYIKKFVLCQACANPETRLTVKKSTIFEICQACGYKGELRSISHSLSNFIIKQHKIEKQGGKKKNKDGEKRKEETKDIYAKDRIKDQKIKVRGDEWGGEDGWDSDSDDDLADQTKKLALSEMKPENMSPEQRGMAFDEYFQGLIESEQLPMMLKSKEKVMEIVMKADYYQVKAKANLVLFDKLFVDENFAATLKKYRVLFCLMNRDVLDAEKIDEKAMKNTMFAVECFFDKFPNQTDKTAHFVKFLYDLDIVEDEQIVEWGESKPSKKYVSKELSAELKEKARRVIEWLKTAESESSEAESDGDDEIAFDERAQVGKVSEEVKVETNGIATVAEEDEDEKIEVVNEDGEAEDIDIDDI